MINPDTTFNISNLEITKMSLSDLDEISDILLTEFDDFWNTNILESELNDNEVLEIENDLEVLNILRKILYIEIDVENGIIVLDDNISYRNGISRYIGEDNAEIVKNWLNRKPDDEYKDFYGSLNNIDKKGEK